MSLEAKVTDLIVEQLGVSKEEAVLNASFIDDLGADSLDIVELVMTLEETFDIEEDADDCGCSWVSEGTRRRLGGRRAGHVATASIRPAWG